MAKAPSPGSSTAITSVYAVRPKAARPSPEPRAARTARTRNGEFKDGELVPGTRYRVLGLLGVGGMGSVYEVEHTELGKRFVLKALLSDLAQRDDLVARVRNEQRALGRLEHPCIVAVTDAGTTSFDVPYFVMERLEGETLAARLKRTGRLALDDALTLAAGVLEGLAAAHHIGVIHRDVKPQNIFVAAGLRPKILDFGVAKIADVSGTITARGVAIGTPRYMSPEQASGEAVDGRSDIYSLGLVLYECLVGRGPFDDVRDANEMLFAHLSRPVPRLLDRVAGMTPELDELVAGLLAKTPAARPPNAASAAAALRAAHARLALAPVPVQPHTVPVAPGLAVPQPTTRLDGVAGRNGARGAGVTLDAPTLPRAVPSSSGLTERIATTASRATHGGTRTEILSAADLAAVNAPAPLGGEAVTRTRVPVTPVAGARTVPPSRASSRLSREGQKRAVVWLFAGVVGVCLGVLSRLDRGPHGPRAVRPTRVVAATAPPTVSSARPAGGVALSLPRPDVPVAPPAFAAQAPSPAPSAPPKSGKTRAPSARKPAEPPKKPVKAGTALKVPAGLPSSGL